MALVVEVLDDEDPVLGDGDPVLDDEGLPGSSASAGRPAEISLADVVAAGEAAYCWLDVVVTLRNVVRHQGGGRGISTAHEPGHWLGCSPTGSTATEER
jgi:hypothetical protein